MAVDVARTLRNLGLSEKEAQLYLLLLTLGAAPASVIGKRFGVPKSTARYACLELAKKGLVASSRKGDTFLFSPEPPDKILFLLEQQKKAIQRRETEAKAAVEALKAMAPQSALPSVQFYEGRDGILAAYRAVFADIPEGGELCGYLHELDISEDVFDFFEPFEELFRLRVERGIRYRVISPRSKLSEAYKAEDSPKILRETRLTDEPYDGHAADILLYGDKLCSMSVEGGTMFAYIVRNASITAMHRLAFELAWKQCAR